MRVSALQLSATETIETLQCLGQDGARLGKKIKSVYFDGFRVENRCARGLVWTHRYGRFFRCAIPSTLKFKFRPSCPVHSANNVYCHRLVFVT